MWDGCPFSMVKTDEYKHYCTSCSRYFRNWAEHGKHLVWLCKTKPGRRQAAAAAAARPPPAAAANPRPAAAAAANPRPAAAAAANPRPAAAAAANPRPAAAAAANPRPADAANPRPAAVVAGNADPNLDLVDQASGDRNFDLLAVNQPGDGDGDRNFDLLAVDQPADGDGDRIVVDQPGGYNHAYSVAHYAPYAPYAPATSPVPALGHDAQMYGAQHYQYPSPYYPSLTPTNNPSPSMPAPAKAEITTPVVADQTTLSAMYHHPGYAYAPYAPYSPATSHVPALGHDAQMYGAQHYQYPSPYYPSLTPTNNPYPSTPAPTKGEITTPVVDDQTTLSAMYHHPGYAYAPYAPYSPATSPVPALGHDAQMYGAQHYQYPSPYYPSLTPTNNPYPSTPAPAEGEITTPVVADQTTLSVDSANSKSSGMANSGGTKNNSAYPGRAYHGSYGRGGTVPGGVPSYHQDPRYAYDGIQSPMPWLDAPYFTDGHSRPLTNSTMTSSFSYGNGYPSRNQNYQPHLMGSHHARPMSGMNTNAGYMNRGYPNKVYGQQYGNSYRSGPENMDGLNKLNRGPRGKISENQKGFIPVALAAKGQNIPFTVTADDEKLSLNAPDKEQHPESSDF